MKPNNSCINLRPSSSSSSSPMTAAKVDMNRRKSHEEKPKKSSNSVTLGLRSASPSIDTVSKQILLKPPSPIKIETATNQTLINSNGDNANNANNLIGHEKSKRKSMSDVVMVQGNLTTYSSIQNEQNKSNSSDSTIKSNIGTNSLAMPSLTTTQTTTTINGTTITLPPAAAISIQDHLHPKLNATTTSNSSLNSSSVRSTTSKSNDGGGGGGASMEKKQKPTNRSRQKKFHRHFKQVAIDEEVINYFSCAFVSDILLQGHLYITSNYIAFYSNVFGYVTKLLIPITSVVRISKEKTVKIIPNAIAVATADERHVFSSFLSRESAYQLMIKCWQDAMPTSDIDVLATSAQLKVCSEIVSSNGGDGGGGGNGIGGDLNIQNSSDAKPFTDEPIFAKVNVTPAKQTLQVVHQRRCDSNSGDLDISEFDDDSSSAISCNESLSRLLKMPKTHLETILSNETHEHPANSSSSSNPSNFDKKSSNHQSISDFDLSKCKIDADSLKSSTPIFNSTAMQKHLLDSTSSSSIRFFNFRIPRTIHIAYFGLSLIIILTLIAIFLFYRINEMKNTRIRVTADDLNPNSPPNVQLFAEILKWQKDLQNQRVHLTRNVLTNNLEQISQISDSLQTLSNLIHANKDDNKITDELSNIMGECSNLEACILDQRSP